MSYRVSSKQHKAQDFVVHQLLRDFEIEDVWQFPVILNQTDTFEDFIAVFLNINDQLMQSGFVALLFRLRFFIGKMLNWDKKSANQILRDGSIRQRYAELKRLSADQLIEPGEKDFVPVYQLKTESLAEIENATVHAALHLSLVPLTEFESTVQMAVYVKPKGLFGKSYMAIIKPFRLIFVYPMIMKLVHKQWSNRHR